jgi:hypothetical protein
MSSIFAKPKNSEVPSFKILFFHGLEGSSNGKKSVYLKNNWKAYTPQLRMKKLIDLKRDNNNKPFNKINKRDVDKALAPALQDAREAVSYIKPDLIIGSSAGGAILMKLISEGVVDERTPVIFLAPAINQLMHGEKIPMLSCSYWILGELDEVVPNDFNIKSCINTNGNLTICPNENHRLASAIDSKLIDAAIVTCIEVSNLS